MGRGGSSQRLAVGWKRVKIKLAAARKASEVANGKAYRIGSYQHGSGCGKPNLPSADQEKRVGGQSRDANSDEWRQDPTDEFAHPAHPAWQAWQATCAGA